MEVLCSQKNSLNLVTCRLCANDCDKAIGIYSEEGLTNHLSSKMNQHLPIKVSQTDTLPLYCCLSCTSTLLTWHELYLVCIESDKRLREFNVIDDKSMDAIEFPDEQSHDVEQEIEPEPEPTTSHELECINSENANSEEILGADAQCFENGDGLLNSLQETKTTLACNNCNQLFKNKLELKLHKQKNHKFKSRLRRKRDEIQPFFFCDICKKGFTRKYDMQKHRSAKHPGETKVENETHTEQKQYNLKLLNECKIVDDDKTYFKCEHCNKTFCQAYNFIRHHTVHTGERAFCCHICGKDFRISTGLQRHINQHHYGIKNYSCDICGKQFAAKVNCDEHKNIHTNTRPFVCDKCGKTFKQKASLRIHKLFHTNNFKHQCSICDKKYRRAQELKIHSWIHTGHKPHKCKICGADFRLKPDMIRHAKIHEKSGEFICNYCGVSFTRKRCLINHEKTVHSQNNEST